MNFVKAITSNVVIADQPTSDDIGALKSDGYAGVVNLRQDGEPEQPIGPAAEGELIGAQGIDYLHVAVGGEPLTKEAVGAFCEFMDKHESEKVLVHCRKGGRAAAMVLLQIALKEKWSADETAAKGAEIGLNVDGGLKQIVEHYLKSEA